MSEHVDGEASERVGPRIKLFGREFRLPRSRPARVATGVALILGGFLGFLPVLGFWMAPLGLIVLSVDFAIVRRARRKSTVYFGRRRRRGPQYDETRK